jgi:hypothetical protein
LRGKTADVEVSADHDHSDIDTGEKVGQVVIDLAKVDPMAHVPKFDIFSGSVDKDAIWIEAVEGLGNAKDRMDELAAKSPGKYFVFCGFSHTVMAVTDTRKEDSDSDQRETGAA